MLSGSSVHVPSLQPANLKSCPCSNRPALLRICMVRGPSVVCIEFHLLLCLFILPNDAYLSTPPWARMAPPRFPHDLLSQLVPSLPLPLQCCFPHNCDSCFLTTASIMRTLAFHFSQTGVSYSFNRIHTTSGPTSLLVVCTHDAEEL